MATSQRYKELPTTSQHNETQKQAQEFILNDPMYMNQAKGIHVKGERTVVAVVPTRWREWSWNGRSTRKLLRVMKMVCTMMGYGLSIKPANLKRDQPWIFIGRIEAEAETPVFWSSDANRQPTGKLRCWKRLRAEGEEVVKGWDGWTASPMQRIWTWANFGRWRGTERPGVLQSMGS